MGQQVAVLLMLLSAFAAASGQEVVPCMTTKENCTGGGMGFSGLSVINNNYYCCAAQYSMTWYNNSLCSCIKTREVIPCDDSPTLCRFATTFSSVDGNISCCYAGYSMQFSSAFINGHYIKKPCTCSRYLGNIGGFMFVNGGMVNGSISWDPNFNATEFDQRMTEFGQRMTEWGQRMTEWGQRFSQSLSSGLLGMAANIQRSASNMRNNAWFNLRRSLGGLGNVFRNRWF